MFTDKVVSQILNVHNVLNNVFVNKTDNRPCTQIRSYVVGKKPTVASLGLNHCCKGRVLGLNIDSLRKTVQKADT